MTDQRTPSETEPIAEAGQRLAKAERIVVLTGAGVSQESGIPTFRDALSGLWAQYDPTQLATPEAFRANPKLVWDFYQFRRDLMRPAEPNAGHRALARLQELHPRVVLITQNVDDLHERAGSRALIRLHGSIWRNRCSANCDRRRTPLDLRDCIQDDGDVPRCPACGAYVRPDVIWFNEALLEDSLTDAFAAAHACAVMLVVGTSGLVTPAALLPEIARTNGAYVIEVNPQPSALSQQVDMWLQGTAAHILPRLVSQLESAP